MKEALPEHHSLAVAPLLFLECVGLRGATIENLLINSLFATKIL
jgi:hypothetical protein